MMTKPPVTVTHESMEGIVQAMAAKGIAGLRVRQSPGRVYESGPVAWATTIHLAKDGEHDPWPAMIIFEAMRGSQRLRARADARPRHNERLPPCSPSDALMARASEVAAKFDAQMGAWVASDVPKAEPPKPARRPRNLAPERVEEVDFDFSGGGDDDDE